MAGAEQAAHGGAAVPARVAADRERAALATAWDEGFSAAHTMARIWGHTDYWEDWPENPHRAALAAQPTKGEQP